jgi:hypothetical protein
VKRGLQPCRELDAQEVLRGGGDEQRGRGVAPLELLPDEVRLGAFVKRVHDGDEHARRSSRGGRHRRGQDRLCRLQAVRQRQRGLAESLDEEQAQAVAEARLVVVQVPFEKVLCKPGYHCIGSKGRNQALSAIGQLTSTCTAPPS